MPFESDKTQPAKAALEQGQDSLVKQALHSAAYAAFQQPVTGVSQIIDNIADTDLQTRTQFMEAPQEAEFGTKAWHAQTIGSAAGGLVPLLLVGKLVKSQMGAATEAETGLLGRRAAIGLTLKESAATGFINDALFRPTAPEGNFWMNRLKNGTSGALTFTAMTAASLSLAGASESSLAKALSAGKALRNPVVSGLISGVPGGAVSAQYDSLVNHHRFATRQELGHSVYSMSLIGGGFGLQHHMFGAKTASGAEIKMTGVDLPKQADTTLSGLEAGKTDAKTAGVIGRKGSDGSVIDMTNIAELLAKFRKDHLTDEFEKPTYLDSHRMGFRDPFMHDPFERRHELYRERYETAEQKALKDVKYAVAKVMLEGLEQAKGNLAEVGADTAKTAEAAGAGATGGSDAAVASGLRISLSEAQAISDLKARSEADARRMVEVLSARGPVEARAASEIMKSSYCDFFPIDKSNLKWHAEQATAYLGAKDVLTEVQNKQAAGASEVAVASPGESKSPITVQEAQALRTFQSQQAYEMHTLSTLLEQRGPVAKWMCEQIAKEYRDYVSQGGGSGVFGGMKFISYSKAGVELVPLSEQHLNELAQRGERYAAAEQLYSDMSRSRYERTAPDKTTAEKTTKKTGTDKAAPAKTAPESSVLSLEEANALATFAAEGSRWQAQELATMLSQRGREAQWICSHIAGSIIDTPNTLVVGKLGRNRVEPVVTVERYADLSTRAHEYVAALDLTERVKTEAKTLVPSGSKKSPISLEEAQAIRVLNRETQGEHLPLIDALSARGPEAEFVARRIRAISSQEPLTQEKLVAINAESGPYVKARGVLAAVEEANVKGTKSGAAPVTLEEANAIQALAKEPGDHEDKLVSALAKRGVAAQFIAEKVKKHEFGGESYNTNPVDQAALDGLTAVSHRYVEAKKVMAELLPQKEAQAKSDPDAQTEPSKETEPTAKTQKPALPETSLSVREADAVATIVLHSSVTEALALVDMFEKCDAKKGWTARYITEHQYVFKEGITDKTLDQLNRAYEIEKVLQLRPKKQIQDYSLFSYVLAQQGISGREEATRYVDLITRMDPPVSQRRWNQNPVEATVKEMANWQSTASLPDWTLGPIHDHVKSTGNSYKSYSAEQLTQAAQAWQADPTIPYALASEVGALPPQKRLAAGVAWREALAEKGITDVSQLKDKPIDADLLRSYHERFQQVGAEGRAAVVGRMSIGQWRALPLAIEALHGRGLSEAAKQGLHQALLENANEPFQVLTGLKGSHFQSAYENIKSRIPPDSRTATYAATTALKLALTFRGGWENWMHVQSKLGRTEHDATFWLSTAPAAELSGLGQTLLQNANRNISQLELMTRRWGEVPVEKREAPFQVIMEHLLTNKYENITDKAFAVEAGAWGMSGSDYKARETRYLASQTVPVPFPLDKVWESGDLRGRFIARSDPRGLFLGQHTNSCQHPDGAARSSAWYGQESAKSGFFVVESKHGDIVAESWAWIADNGGVAFDNVEAKGIGNRTTDVKKIYQQAANELAKEHHIVTLGTSHSDLDVAGWNDAGDSTLKLPADYSGYTDATKQVTLSNNPDLKREKRSTVRGALVSDLEALEKISKARYPEGWQGVPLDANTRGLVIEEPGNGVIGYALIEPDNHYISDVAVMPDANVNKTVALLRSLTQLVKQIGGQWSADCRDGTSYRLLKSLESKGRIKILSDNVTNRMGNEDMHHVQFVAMP